MVDKLVEEKVPDVTTLASELNHTAIPAAQVLQDFLNEKGIELRLTPPQVRMIENGGMLIDQPQIVANYRAVSNIPVASKN